MNDDIKKYEKQKLEKLKKNNLEEQQRLNEGSINIITCSKCYKQTSEIFSETIYLGGYSAKQGFLESKTTFSITNKSYTFYFCKNCVLTHKWDSIKLGIIALMVSTVIFFFTIPTFFYLIPLIPIIYIFDVLTRKNYWTVSSLAKKHGNNVIPKSDNWNELYTSEDWYSIKNRDDTY